jgi:hypothetical protein
MFAVVQDARGVAKQRLGAGNLVDGITPFAAFAISFFGVAIFAAKWDIFRACPPWNVPMYC